MRGYFGIGVENLKNGLNLGTLWRHAYNMGASFMFTIGREYVRQLSDTAKAYRHIPLFRYKSFEELNIPYDCPLIGVEIDDKAEDLIKFTHPERAIYILGPEDGSLSNKVKSKCHRLVKLSTKYCLNVAVMGSILMYDRMVKRQTNEATQ